MADSDLSASSSSLPFRILFEDQHLIVLSKPAGLLSQGDVSGQKCLVDYLREYFGRHYVGLIHRLDRNTSGLMVVAKRSKSADRLTQQLQKGTLVREYRAILFGALEVPRSTETHPSLRWEHWLFKDEQKNKVRSVKPQTPGAKHAVLNLWVEKVFHFPNASQNLTQVKIALETGRSHQIRAQCSAMRYPLVGDTKYGDANSMTLFTRPALHSCALTLLHPISQEKMTFEDWYSPDMETTFRRHVDSC